MSNLINTIYDIKTGVFTTKEVTQLEVANRLESQRKLEAEQQLVFEQELARAEARQAAEAKLLALGLTTDDLKALLG